MRFSVIKSASRLNRELCKQISRKFSFKYDISRKGETDAAIEETATTQATPSEETCRYSVSQEKKTTNESAATSTPHPRKQVRPENHNLQPSMMPAYYQRSMETNALVDLNPSLSERDKISNTRFAPSKTCANVTLPLKMVKLASPFPDPVKQMMSRTVSDDEKALQMLAEARSQRHYAEQSRSGTMLGARNIHTPTRRCYSKIVMRQQQDKLEKIKTQAVAYNKKISTINNAANNNNNKAKNGDVTKKMGEMSCCQVLKKQLRREVFLASNK